MAVTVAAGASLDFVALPDDLAARVRLDALDCAKSLQAQGVRSVSDMRLRLGKRFLVQTSEHSLGRELASDFG